MARQGCGTSGGYRQHMEDKTPTCAACKKARAKWQRGYEIRIYLNNGNLLMVDSTGFRRRLQALMTLGYTGVEMAELMGTSGTNITRAIRNTRKIRPESLAKCLVVYDKLSMVIPPDGRAKKLAKNAAAKNGFLPPFAWDEDTIDDPYAIPTGVRKPEIYAWFTKCATDTERVEYVLQTKTIPNPPK